MLKSVQVLLDIENKNAATNSVKIKKSYLKNIRSWMFNWWSDIYFEDFTCQQIEQIGRHSGTIYDNCGSCLWQKIYCK